MLSNNKLDKTDVLVSIGSGSLTALMDVFWVKDISLADAHQWGTTQVNTFVKKVARSQGFKGKDDDLTGAVKFLENEYPISADDLTDQFGGGTAHHLRDFSHHPTPIGLIFSILSQFTGRGYGTDTLGKFTSYEIPGWKKMGWEESVYMGTVMWLFHMISDVAGSSSSLRVGKEGTGLPGPILSFIKEASSIPGIRQLSGHAVSKNGNSTDKYNFPVLCSKLFNGTLLGEHDIDGKPILHKELRFDLRTELGIVHESVKNKQYVPVVLNVLIVSSFYSVRRFIKEIEINKVSEISQFDKIDVRKCLPWNNDAVRHMRMISAATFSSIDITAAGIRSAIKNKNNKPGFALDFMQGINYWGLGNLVIASNSELSLGMEKLYGTYLDMAEKVKGRIIEMLPNGQKDLNIAQYGITTGMAVAGMGTPIGFISATIGVYDLLKKSIEDLKAAKQNRIEIEKECRERIKILEDYTKEMENCISEYFTFKYIVIAKATEKIGKAMKNNDIDSFILGNNMIQNEMGKNSQFTDMNSFDSLMLSDDAIKI